MKNDIKRKISDLSPAEYRLLMAEYKRLDRFVGLDQSFDRFINAE